jgi:hypothetical protein
MSLWSRLLLEARAAPSDRTRSSCSSFFQSKAATLYGILRPRAASPKDPTDQALIRKGLRSRTLRRID